MCKKASSLPAGKHALFAFADANANGKWDPAIPEAIGWYSNMPSGRPTAVDANNPRGGEVSIMLTAPHTMPKNAEFKNSALRNFKGYTVLHLKRDAVARGLAHGRLLARPFGGRKPHAGHGPDAVP